MPPALYTKFHVMWQKKKFQANLLSILSILGITPNHVTAVHSVILLCVNPSHKLFQNGLAKACFSKGWQTKP